VCVCVSTQPRLDAVLIGVARDEKYPSERKKKKKTWRDTSERSFYDIFTVFILTLHFLRRGSPDVNNLGASRISYAYSMIRSRAVLFVLE
jgi:hypothetical protein